jgi:hypothetical protein
MYSIHLNNILVPRGYQSFEIARKRENLLAMNNETALQMNAALSRYLANKSKQDQQSADNLRAENLESYLECRIEQIHRENPGKSEQELGSLFANLHRELENDLNWLEAFRNGSTQSADHDNVAEDEDEEFIENFDYDKGIFRM